MNKNLHIAKSSKNDEFYTQITDIEKELKHYRSHFKNKVIYMNCDDPEWSNFWMFFKMNFDFLGFKKIISTHYHNDHSTYKLEYDGKEVIKTPLEQNGDFRSPESIELLKEADIVVTNPPFSLFREYVAQLVEYNKKFVILGNNNAITYKEIFPLLKDGDMWLGHTSNKTMEFQLSNDYDRWDRMDEDGNKYGKVPAISWFTNLDYPKRHEDILLYKEYNEDDYPQYDNYNAIEVSKVAEIPMDYDGIMGVPITFMSRFNPEQFEIIGMTTGRSEFSPESYPSKRYKDSIQHNKNGTITNGSKMNTRATLPVEEGHTGVYYTASNSDKKLKMVYARILIKRK